MNSSSYSPRLIEISFRTQDPNIKIGRIWNPRKPIHAQSTVFSKSGNPHDLPQKPTIHALFKAKSVDPKTYSPPSFLFILGLLLLGGVIIYSFFFFNLK